jgi:hypothetical protein
MESVSELSLCEDDGKGDKDIHISFENVSFSYLGKKNNLKDISMSPHYAEVCGITEKELHANFDEVIVELADANNQTKEQAYEKLRRMYDGYHFCENSVGMYNPFSVLLTLSDNRYDDYWFATGTPTYLVELLKKSGFDLQALSNYETSESALSSIHRADINPIPVLFQSGYLTIKGYDKEFGVYKLDYPNEEVRQGFEALKRLVISD